MSWRDEITISEKEFVLMIGYDDKPHLWIKQGHEIRPANDKEIALHERQIRMDACGPINISFDRGDDYE